MPDQSTPQISTTGAGVLLLVMLLAGYVGSFYFFSRHGYPAGAQYDFVGYYFADPFSEAGEERHFLLARFYWPLVEIDARLISGQRPGASMLERFSCVDVDTVDYSRL